MEEKVGVQGLAHFFQYFSLVASGISGFGLYLFSRQDKRISDIVDTIEANAAAVKVSEAANAVAIKACEGAHIARAECERTHVALDKRLDDVVSGMREISKDMKVGIKGLHERLDHMDDRRQNPRN